MAFDQSQADDGDRDAHHHDLPDESDEALAGQWTAQPLATSRIGRGYRHSARILLTAANLRPCAHEARFICCMETHFLQHMLHGPAAAEALPPQ